MTQIISDTRPAQVEQDIVIENPDARPFWASKGVVGGFVSLLAWLGTMFGLDLAQTDVETLTMAFVAIAGAVASIVSIIGRLTAKRPIK